MIKQLLLLLIFIMTFGCSESFESGFDGDSAYRYVEQMVGFGRRVSGSKELELTANFIADELKKSGATDVQLMRFITPTPHGETEMINVIGHIKVNTSNKFLIVSSHYDLKMMDGEFDGANDSGSSTAVLMELVKHLKNPHYNIMVVFYDGEECFEHYSHSDGLYGSKYLRDQLVASGEIANCVAVINVDMVGDKDLKFTLPANSDLSLYRVLREGAELQNLTECLSFYDGNILDDHEPFREIGVKAINIIDFDFGDNNSLWHTSGDNLTNISAESLTKTGKLLHYLLENYK